MPGKSLATKRIAVRPDTFERIRQLAGSAEPYKEGWLTHDRLINLALDVYIKWKGMK